MVIGKDMNLGRSSNPQNNETQNVENLTLTELAPQHQY